MSEEERLYKANGEVAGLPDICKWWTYHYPEDIFVTSPPEVIAIRNEMKVIIDKLEKRRGGIQKKSEGVKEPMAIYRIVIDIHDEKGNRKCDVTLQRSVMNLADFSRIAIKRTWGVIRTLEREGGKSRE